MSRTVITRRILKVVVQAVRPLHLGSSAGGYDTDMELVRDGQGRLLLPGTSLAGAIRAALANDEPDADHDTLWGGGPASGNAAASYIFVDDAPQLGVPETAIRDGVSIDRHHGAAVDHLLYSREIILPGAQFDVTITVDDPTPGGSNGPAATVVEKIEKLLTGTGLDIGGASRRGLGRIRVGAPPTELLDRNILVTQHLGTRAGMISLLRGQTERKDVTVRTDDVVDPGTIRITIHWDPVGAVMSGQSVAALAADTVPATTVDENGDLRLLLAGTGIAGALGAHIERIARTLAAVSDAAAPSRRDLPGAADLLGLPGANQSGEPAGAAAALAVSDCLGTAHINGTDWKSALLNDISDPNSALKPNPAPTLDGSAADLVRFQASLTGAGMPTSVVTHVAIDRWTGGAADGLLYAVAEPARNTAWEPIQLTVDVKLLNLRGRGDTGWALLLLALKDLAAGKIALGAYATRGLGTIRLQAAGMTFTAAADVSATQSIAATLAAHGTLDRALADPALTRVLQDALRDGYPQDSDTAA